MFADPRQHRFRFSQSKRFVNTIDFYPTTVGHHINHTRHQQSHGGLVRMLAEPFNPYDRQLRMMPAEPSQWRFEVVWTN